MSQALQITLDSSSTFEALLPIRDQLVSAEGAVSDITPEVDEDTPQTVLFALGQVLCAAVAEDQLTADAVGTLADTNEAFGAVFNRSGLANLLAN